MSWILHATARTRSSTNPAAGPVSTTPLRYLAAIVLSLLVPAVPAAQGAEPIADLRRHFDGVRADTGFRAATRDDAAVAESVFFRLLTGRPAAGDRDALAALGFIPSRVRLDAGGTAQVVADTPGDIAGRGYFLVGEDAAPLLVQAPHRFKDLDTGAILMEIAAAMPLRAAAWNVVPRRTPDDRVRGEADLAHVDVSYFNAFTRAFARTHSNGVVIQLHGFATEKRRTRSGRRAAVIVSNGTETLAGPARRVRDCLARALPGPVMGYGEDVFELGATTNRNAAALRSIGFDRFVHVELSRDLRRRLLAEPRLRAALYGCLRAAADGG